MKEKSSFNTLEALVLIIAVATALYLIVPQLPNKHSSAKELSVKHAAIVLNTAIKDFAISHRGDFPAQDEVLGGDAKDTLIKESILIEYPLNPYSKNNERMKNVPEGFPSPGNFSYVRGHELSHEFKLYVYGKNGKVYKYRRSVLD